MAISERAHEILNRQDLIEKRDLWYERLQNVFDGTLNEWNQENTFGIMQFSYAAEDATGKIERQVSTVSSIATILLIFIKNTSFL